MIKSYLSKNGFTFIELLIIIIILGLLTVITIPAFRHYKPVIELSSSARDLASDIRYSQQLAITEQINHGIYFSVATDVYQITKYGATEEIIEEKSLSDQVSFQEITGFTDDKVIFNPYGAALEGGIITLINVKGATTQIEVKPSGFLKITD